MRTNQEQISRFRRVLNLWLPFLSIERFCAQAELRVEERPVVLALDDHGRRVVAAACPGAAEAGITIGRTVSDALALEPKLLVAQVDLTADRTALDALATWCTRYTPLVALDPAGTATAGTLGDGGLWLDVTGCAHLFGGEVAMLKDLAARLARLGWTARIALADTPGAAWAVAHHGREAVTVIPPGTHRQRIASLPLAALRLPAVVTEDLNRLGLRRVGTLFKIARAPLTARFGAQVALRLDQALGHITEPVSPQAPVSPHRVHIAFPEPIAVTEDITRTTQRLLSRLTERLEREQCGARRLRLLFHRVDGTVRSLTIATARANRNPDTLFRLFAEHFDKLDAGFGIELVTLDALALDAAPAHQITLDQHASADGTTDTMAVANLADRLANRLGIHAVARPIPCKSHIPERAEALVSVIENSHVDWTDEAAGPVAPRPLRLLRRPEQVEAVSLLPDLPPIRFRWRGGNHRIDRAAGPERLATEWWRAGAHHATRDYFRIEDQNGRRYWLFREGLAERGEMPVWYLHGLFA